MRSPTTGLNIIISGLNDGAEHHYFGAQRSLVVDRIDATSFASMPLRRFDIVCACEGPIVPACGGRRQVRGADLSCVWRPSTARQEQQNNRHRSFVKESVSEDDGPRTIVLIRLKVATKGSRYHINQQKMKEEPFRRWARACRLMGFIECPSTNGTAPSVDGPFVPTGTNITTK